MGNLQLDLCLLDVVEKSCRCAWARVQAKLAVVLFTRQREAKNLPVTKRICKVCLPIEIRGGCVARAAARPTRKLDSTALNATAMKPPS